MFLIAYIAFAILQIPFTLPSTVPPSTSENLVEDFFKIFPKQELEELKAKHLKTDPGYRAAVKYFQSPEWAKLVEDVRQSPRWVEFKEYIKAIGVDMDFLIRHIEHCIKATNTSDFEVDDVKPSLSNLIEDFRITHGINLLKGIQGYLWKMGNTDAYKKFMKDFTSPRAKELLEKALKEPAVEKLIGKLKEIGLNVENLLGMIYAFNGWKPSAAGTP